MKLDDLVEELKATLNDAASVFSDDEAFERHIHNAAAGLGEARPLVKQAELTIVAEQLVYAAPVDYEKFHSASEHYKLLDVPAWDPRYAGPLPNLRLQAGVSGRELVADPPFSHKHIALLGSTFKFNYFAPHVISNTAGATTVQAADKGLLLLRAQAETMKELAHRNSKKPVKLRDGLNSHPKNGTPVALHESLMKEFRRQAGLVEVS